MSCVICNQKISKNTIAKHFRNSTCTLHHKYIFELSIKNVFRAFVGMHADTTLREFDTFIRNDILKEPNRKKYNHISDFTISFGPKRHQYVVFNSIGENVFSVENNDENIIEYLKINDTDEITNNLDMEINIDNFNFKPNDKMTYTYDYTKDIKLNIKVFAVDGLDDITDKNMLILGRLDFSNVKSYIKNHEDNMIMQLYDKDHDFAEIVDILGSINGY